MLGWKIYLLGQSESLCALDEELRVKTPILISDCTFGEGERGMALGDRCIEATYGEPLTDLVLRWAEERPAAPAFTFVNYGSHRDGLKTTLTWGETHRRACATAARLRRFAEPGERVALLLPQGLEYLTTMLGSMYARTIAVPLFSPDLPGRSASLVGAYADADPAVVVSTSGILPEVAVM